MNLEKMWPTLRPPAARLVEMTPSPKKCLTLKKIGETNQEAKEFKKTFVFSHTSFLGGLVKLNLAD